LGRRCSRMVAIDLQQTETSSMRAGGRQFATRRSLCVSVGLCEADPLGWALSGWRMTKIVAYFASHQLPSPKASGGKLQTVARLGTLLLPPLGDWKSVQLPSPCCIQTRPSEWRRILVSRRLTKADPQLAITEHGRGDAARKNGPNWRCLLHDSRQTVYLSRSPIAK